MKKAVKNARANGNANRPGPEDNGGSYRRFQLIKSSLSGAEGISPGIRCQDPMKPEEDLNFLEKLVAQITPACAGDGFVVFTRFGEGIIPGGEDEYLSYLSKGLDQSLDNVCLQTTEGANPKAIP